MTRHLWHAGFMIFIYAKFWNESQYIYLLPYYPYEHLWEIEDAEMTYIEN
jgi:hypothetical protein